MTNKTTEALKLADWVSDKCRPRVPSIENWLLFKKALAAIREALAGHSGDGNEMVAEPANTRSTSEYSEHVKQEPVAIVDEIGKRLDGTYIFNAVGKVDVGQPLYAAPVRTKDLTDDEIAKWFGAATEGSLISFARAVIEKFKEKNRG